MPVNRWTGDAPSVAKQIVFRAPAVDATSARVVVSIGKNSLAFGEWNPAEIIRDLNDSGFAELIGITLSATGRDGLDLTATGVQNEDFDLSVSIEPTVGVEFSQGQSQVNQYSLLDFQGATSGTFTLTCNGETTAAIQLKNNGTLNAAGIESAINSLTSFASGDVTATVRDSLVRLEWLGSYAGTPVVVTINGDGLDNGASVVITERQPARPATNDVWFMGSDADFQFDLSDGTTPVTLKTNDSDDEMAAKLTDAWGGKVEVISELLESSQTVKDRFYIINMRGFPGVSTTLSISNTLPSLGTPGMVIEKVFDRTDTTPSELWIVDLREGSIAVTINGSEVDLPPTGAGLRLLLNEAVQFQEWWTYNLLSAGAGLNQDMFGSGLYILEWRSDSSRLANQYQTATPLTDGGLAFPDGMMSVAGEDGAQLLHIQRGGPTNGSDSAIHEIHLEANDADRLDDLSGTFRLAFPEGETASISVGASAAALDTLVEAATGITVATTGSGTPANPYVIDYTADTAPRRLPTVAEKLIVGDGSASVATSRAAATARSAIATVSVSPDADGGIFRLRSGNEGPVSFDYGDNAATFKANLEQFPSLSTTGDTAVTYSADQGTYVITYQSGLANQPVPSLGVIDSSLTTSNSVNTTKEIVVQPSGPGNFNAPKNWALGRRPESGDTLVLDRGESPIIYGFRLFHEVAIDATSDVLTVAGGTDLQNDQKVQFVFGSVAPTGLSAATDYFVINIDHAAGTFQVATSVSGTPVDITATGTGPHFCGVIPDDIKIVASFTDGIGLPFRNDDGYDEYRQRYLQMGIAADGQIEIGQGDGSGSGRIHIDIGNSGGQITVFDSGSTETIGQPPIVINALTDLGNLLIYGGDVGIATYDDETAKIGSFHVVAGSLVIGGLTVSGNAIWSSGTVESKRLSVAGLVNVR